MIGEYFNITPYYVSNIFKKSENISMLDYISVTRINKAKELITDTDLNLEAIALQCGFSNIRTFMRTFQKFEIVTPGKYKELNKVSVWADDSGGFFCKKRRSSFDRL